MADFPSTQWSLIRASGLSPTLRRVAFGTLAHDYRPAIVAFFRARLAAADAEDATQSFFAASFEHGWWARADAGLGSFRGFLLVLLRRHLGHVLERVPVEAGGTDAVDVADTMADAEQRFDARFALVLTARASDRVRAAYDARGRAALADRLLPMLGAPPEHGQLQAAAASLGLAPNTLSVELKRLRARLREALRDEVRALSADEAMAEREWGVLTRILGG